MSFSNSNSPETGVGIKKPNQVEYISKDERDARIQSIAKSKRDIVWWAKNFFHIITLDKGLTKIQPYPKQEEMLQFIANNNRIITLASRQVGKCIFKDTYITVRNRNTQKTEKIKISDFFERFRN